MRSGTGGKLETASKFNDLSEVSTGDELIVMETSASDTSDGDSTAGISLVDLAEVLDQHKLWVETSGESGSKADLCGVNLANADLTGVNLEGADLHKARLYGADLSMANLRGANLVQA